MPDTAWTPEQPIVSIKDVHKSFGPLEALVRHTLLNLDDAAVIGYEPNSGDADPYLTTTGFIHAARKRGVEVGPDCPTTGLVMDGDRVAGVQTREGTIAANHVVSCVGPWTASLTSDLDFGIALEISRHIVLTFRAGHAYGRDLPIVKDLTTANKMYFRPSSGGVVLVGTGDHGDPVAGADDLDEAVPEDFVLHQGGQIAQRMPSFAEAGLTASWVGPYDITRDWNPVLGPAPGLDGLTLAFGFSGHGVKLAPAVGKVLAQSVLGQAEDVPLHPYRFGRFAENDLLTGAYGIGSIS